MRSASRVLVIALWIALWIALLFGSAGTVDWPRGWIFVALYSIAWVAMWFVLRRFNPGLIEARTKLHLAETRAFDRVFMALYTVLMLAQTAVAGLDAVRFRWTSMPFWCVYAGAALALLAFALAAWTMALNPFAETTVRIQSERGHTVIDFGPYRFVRHPMYVAIILMHVAAPLVQGSVWALVVAIPIAIVFVVRTAFEDRTLRLELAGYEAYTGRTRFRLVPGVW